MSLPAPILLIGEPILANGSLFETLRDTFPQWQVYVVKDRGSFERILATGNFELAISSVALGWSDGLEVLARIKEVQSECPVILCTHQADDEFALRAINAGAEDVVPDSPYALAYLISALKKNIASNQQRREISAAMQRYHCPFAEKSS